MEVSGYLSSVGRLKLEHGKQVGLEHMYSHLRWLPNHPK